LAYWSTSEEFVIQKKDTEVSDSVLPPNRAHWEKDAITPPKAFDKCPGCFGESKVVQSLMITPKAQFYVWPISPTETPYHDPQELSIRKNDVWQSPSTRTKPSDCTWVMGRRQRILDHYEPGAEIKCVKRKHPFVFIVVVVLGMMALIGCCFYYGYQLYILYRPSKKHSGIRRRCQDCIQAKTKADEAMEAKYPNSDECVCCGAGLGRPPKTTAYGGPDYSQDML
jgi:hypothetical protein